VIRSAGTGAIALAATLLCGAGILSVLGASPLDAYRLIAAGAVGRPDLLSYALSAWAPVLLCAGGLLLTFAAGLWNIGIEGQIIAGAVAATGALRVLGSGVPPWAALGLAGLAALAAGGMWALLAGVLRTYGDVSEIFGGLGLNFIAGSLTVYLVLGPWGRPGITSTSGTPPFPGTLWLPVVGVAGVSVPLETLGGVVAVALVSVALRGTYFGLRLKAIGKSLRAAFLLGIPTTREVLKAFAGCGALAGLAGFVLVTGTYSRHQLYPLVSSGNGFLAILVVLLAGSSAPGAIVISGVFAAISTGSIQLPLVMHLDSSISGVLQALLVLAMLLVRGLQARPVHREG
jgi:simple sugar transport system permease protein